MPKASRTFQMAGANLALHKHSPERYINLWKRMFSLERAVRVRGDTFAMIGTIHEVDPKDPEAGFHGTIFKFTKIDKRADWFDMRSNRVAEHDVVEKEVQIPDWLQPNCKYFQYYFDIRKHRAVIETENRSGTFSPHGFQTMIEQLVNLPEIKKEFSDAEVTVEQSREVLRTIMRKGGLKYLRIVVKRPNPDDGETAERKVLEELSNQNASRTVAELYANTGETLVPNQRTKLLAKVEASNGQVEGEILDENNDRVPVSSLDHPHRQPYRQRSGQSLTGAFVTAAITFVRDLLN
jgi:hypothetical protein